MGEKGTPKQSKQSTATTSPESTDTSRIDAAISHLPGGAQYIKARNEWINIIPQGEFVWFTVKTIISLGFIIGLLMFMTGVTTPFAAVTSGSMEPRFNQGDMVIVTDANAENPPPLAKNGKVIPKQQSLNTTNNKSAKRFGQHGSVIIFTTKNTENPIIHRAHFYVEQGENWVKNANETLLNGKTCTEILQCPAPRSGYITAGDNNDIYDQVNPNYGVVPYENIVGIAQHRVPAVGWIINAVDF